MLAAAWAAVALAAAQPHVAPSPSPEVRLETAGPGRHRVSLVGLDEAQRAAVQSPAARTQALAVFAGAIASDTPAVAGRYELDADGLHFLPLFRFNAGVRYTARVRLGALALDRPFEVDAPASAPPEVAGLYPSGGTLPANTLRLYVQFSRPMAARDSTRHVHLREADGTEVPLAFVEVEGGLWDPGGTRLTLFFHPGRVKRGVAPGERMGPALQADREYVIEVDGEMPDAAGVPLGRPFRHRFRAVAPDRAPPRVDGVAIEPPAGARGPLALRLPEPLDHALLQRLVWIEDARGARVPGRAEVSDGETRWVFTPERPWTPGGHEVLIEAALEDRAGNRFDRAFDREAGLPASGAGERLRLPFVVRGSVD